MKFINQSCEQLFQCGFDLVSIKKFIERCARVTYKSEGNITPTSYEKFVDNLIKNDHTRPLEFGTVHLRMSAFMYDNLLNILINRGMLNQMWIKAVEEPKDGDDMLVTTNYRYYLDIIKESPVFEGYFTTENNECYPKRYTFKFTTDRGIMDDLRTHVSLSHLGESTRWINYNKEKFNHELSFIDFSSSPGEMETLNSAFQYAEDEYMLNISKGLQPQQARRGLPLGIKSELISCGFEDAWSNFIYRRCNKAAHPMAQDLAAFVAGTLFPLSSCPAT